ncbi:MAG TPA: hypothetical protein DEQ98_07725, partial [Acidobacteria bacterium]|nr:hypothetical protein [Acidobacteriota bacterium]
ALLPLAIPGALLHLPVAWSAMTAGERLSDDRDDVATLKIITTVLLLPLAHAAAAVLTGLSVGWWWGVGIGALLPLSFLASIKLVEVQANMTLATLTNLRLRRFSLEVEELRETRRRLVVRVREVADRHAGPNLPRVRSRHDSK